MGLTAREVLLNLAVFIKQVTAIFFSGSSRISFSKFMKFLVGTDTALPLGLPSPISVNFIHTCSPNCNCKLKVSTCTLTISLPVHYKNIGTMTQAVEDSVLLSHGFDNI